MSPSSSGLRSDSSSQSTDDFTATLQRARKDTGAAEQAVTKKQIEEHKSAAIADLEQKAGWSFFKKAEA